MAAREDRVRAAANELRKAISEMSTDRAPLNPWLGGANWRAIGKTCIVNWVDDAERACTRIARALDLVEAVGDTEDARDAIEGALWRIAAAREKLEAVFALSFGVPSMEPYRRTSARFEPNTDGIKAKLRALAETHDAARELAELGRSLAEHPGVTLRDQLSHQLAAIVDHAELCWIDVAHMRNGGFIGWAGGPFYGEDVLNIEELTRDAIWSRAVASVDECFELLVRTFGVMATLVREAAVLEPPQAVYKDEDTGEIWTRDPRLPAPSLGTRDELGRLGDEPQ